MPIFSGDVSVLASTPSQFYQDHLFQNQNSMLLIGVCSLGAGNVTLLPSWIMVAILVTQPIPDLISD